ncbi:MAG: hypothetical protein KC917_01140 [Candidatus Omnitrophica bacterium]|nr:hypothetical protein [Candidatus Omnitrophota bacterium]
MNHCRALRTFLATLLLCVCLMTLGCRRNLMQISSIPSGAEVFVEGKPIRYEDTNLRMARRIDSKKSRGSALNAEEQAFEDRRKEFQTTPIEYEFKTIGAGYQLYCNKEGYLPAKQIVFIEPRWYEYPPIDLFVDILPFTITDTREFSFDLVPEERNVGVP